MARRPRPQTASTPVWLLDVDGVLNADRPGWGAPARQGHVPLAGFYYRLRWSPGLVERVTALHESGSVEIRWATTWVDHIELVERLLRLPAFASAFRGLGQLPAYKAPLRKLDAALGVVEVERRPLVWTDDDAIPGGGEARDRLELAGVPVMFIVPDPRTGLQPEDLDAIEEFIATCGG